MEGNLRFKIDWATLIDGRKFTVFALFCFVFEGNFQVQIHGGGGGRGASIRGGDLTEVFALRVWGAYIWRGLFSEFYGNYLQLTYLRPCSTVWKCKRNVSVS